METIIELRPMLARGFPNGETVGKVLERLDAKYSILKGTELDPKQRALLADEAQDWNQIQMFFE